MFESPRLQASSTMVTVSAFYLCVLAVLSARYGLCEPAGMMGEIEGCVSLEVSAHGHNTACYQAASLETLTVLQPSETVPLITWARFTQVVNTAPVKAT